MNPHKMKRYVITIKNSSNVIIFYLFFVILCYYTHLTSRRQTRLIFLGLLDANILMRHSAMVFE